MTIKHATLPIAAAAFLISTSGATVAQAPTDTPPKAEQADIDRDFDWGLLGLVGLFGLAGLAGRRGVPVTRRIRQSLGPAIGFFRLQLAGRCRCSFSFQTL